MFLFKLIINFIYKINFIKFSIKLIIIYFTHLFNIISFKIYYISFLINFNKNLNLFINGLPLFFFFGKIVNDFKNSFKIKYKLNVKTKVFIKNEY